MKHLKAFEFYFYQKEEEMEEPQEDMMPPYGEEEMGEEEMEDFESMEDDDTYEYEPNMGEEEFGNKISSFKNYKESTCPSCNCMDCECGSEKEETFEAKKMTKKEKELAAKYPPKDKITRGDIITAAKENADKKKGSKKEDKEEDKKEDEKTSKKDGLTKGQKKLPPALQKAIASGVRD